MTENLVPQIEEPESKGKPLGKLGIAALGAGFLTAGVPLAKFGYQALESTASNPDMSPEFVAGSVFAGVGSAMALAGGGGSLSAIIKPVKQNSLGTSLEEKEPLTGPQIAGATALATGMGYHLLQEAKGSHDSGHETNAKMEYGLGGVFLAIALGATAGAVKKALSNRVK